jgi:ribosomal peptide maturation radical SAM protein 1
LRPRVVALVSMPFHLSMMPPIGLGLLSAALKKQGIDTRVYNLNLAFLPLLSTNLQEAAAIHDELSTQWEYLPGEWLFSPPAGRALDEQFLRQLASVMPGRDHLLRLLGRLRGEVAPFIRRCAELLALGKHDIVGFTSSFMQTQPSMAVARLLKQMRPDTKVLFGGANAFSEMGTAFLEQWSAVDVVAHGEADALIVDLVRALRGEGVSLDAIRGVSLRRDGRIVDQSDGGRIPVLDELPVPDYDDYFRDVEDLRRLWSQDPGLPHYLPIETARGCWWGAKSHCTFCGLNADRMAFRSKTPAAAVRSFRELYQRYGVPNFYAVDNIIDFNYFDTVLKELSEHRPSFFIHYELKANLKRSQVEALDAAGVRKVQPGIESLSTPILQLMRKGITAIQNVQTLKWLTEFDMSVTWFVLYGFPTESIEPYQQMAKLLPKLFHLVPPADLAPVLVERFSPYYSQPDAFRIRITEPTKWYRYAFHDAPVGRLPRLAYRFDYVEPGRDPAINRFVESVLAELVDQWIRAYRVDGCTIGIVHGPDESSIVCGPFDRPDRLLRIDGGTRLVLLECEGITSEQSLVQRLEQQCTAPTPMTHSRLGPPPLEGDEYTGFLRSVRAPVIDQRGCDVGAGRSLLDRLESSGVIMREGSKVLALPVNWTARARNARETVGFASRAGGAYAQPA